MSYPVVDRYRIENYTFDREYYVVTTNASESGKWETSVFCNDPATDIRDFESLVEQIIFDDQQTAKYKHSEMLFKWNTVELSLANYNI